MSKKRTEVSTPSRAAGKKDVYVFFSQSVVVIFLPPGQTGCFRERGLLHPDTFGDAFHKKMALVSRAICFLRFFKDIYWSDAGIRAHDLMKVFK